MKTSEIASKYGFRKVDLEEFLKGSRFEVRTGLMKVEVNDSDVEAIVAEYSQLLEDKKRETEQRMADIEQARIEKERACAAMLITSGFTFDGYTITKYSGYISGDDAIQIERGRVGLFTSGTNVGNALTDSLVRIRRNALQELKEAAYALGCNAVIGVDFDYITLEPETANTGGGTTYLPYVFCVTANGNAVVIEKNKTQES